MANYSSIDITERMALAERLAREAGRLALDYFNHRSDLVIEEKKNAQDLVSEADKEVELLIRRGVKAAFPSDALLGEEHGMEGGTDGFIWVIDPIDVTSPFLTGMPTWAVSIAVAFDAAPIVGAVFLPALDEMYVAGEGQGATLNGRLLSIDREHTLASRTSCVDSTAGSNPEAAARAILNILQAGGSYARFGSAAVELVYVASNKLVAAYLAMARSWDCFGGLCIVKEAGGRVMPYLTRDGTLSGQATVLVAAPQVYDDFVSLMPEAIGILSPKG